MPLTGSYNLLIIEDNPGDFSLVEDYLSDELPNCAVEQAPTFRQAKVRLSQPSPGHFDAILLDLTLPDKSGRDLIADIISLASGCPVIILTGHEDLEFSISSISQGISDYVLKDDLTPSLLCKSILYAIERNKVLTELNDTRRRYSDLFHLSPQAMYVFDPETLKFTQVNEAALILYGYTETEFLELRLPDIRVVPIGLTAAEEQALLSHGEGLYTNAVEQRRKSGEIIEVEIHSAPLIVNGKMLRSVVAVDVTERNRFEITLSRAIIKAQEDERYEVGSELHDNVCQILATSNMGFAMIKESIPDAARPLFTQSHEAILMASREIRKLSHRLAPAFYESRTLKDEFTTLLQTFNLESRYELNLSFDAAANAQQLSMDTKISLYRILQEQLKNIFKYANGTKIDVEVGMADGGIRMTVSDNGVGCDLSLHGNGIGLANMKRRAVLSSGKFEAISAPGEGYTIRVDIPVHDGSGK